MFFSRNGILRASRHLKYSLKIIININLIQLIIQYFWWLYWLAHESIPSNSVLDDHPWILSFGCFFYGLTILHVKANMLDFSNLRLLEWGSCDEYPSFWDLSTFEPDGYASDGMIYIAPHLFPNLHAQVFLSEEWRADYQQKFDALKGAFGIGLTSWNFIGTLSLSWVTISIITGWDFSKQEADQLDHGCRTRVSCASRLLSSLLNALYIRWSCKLIFWAIFPPACDHARSSPMIISWKCMTKIFLRVRGVASFCFENGPAIWSHAIFLRTSLEGRIIIWDLEICGQLMLLLLDVWWSAGTCIAFINLCSIGSLPCLPVILSSIIYSFVALSCWLPFVQKVPVLLVSMDHRLIWMSFFLSSL